MSRIDNMECLVDSFTQEEINEVIKRLPLDKALGPGGFNGLFMKICWHIIKHDFDELCQDFYEGDLDITSINWSYITLVPKKPTPETVSDYRLISLVNSDLKLLTKLLAKRDTTISSFLNSRTIQDCLAWVS